MPERSYGPAPSGVQGQSPWSESLGAKPPEAESFLFHFFSEARAEIKRFDRFWRMMAQNTRNHAKMCLFNLLGVKIFNVVLATGRQTTTKIIKMKQQFYS